MKGIRLVNYIVSGAMVCVAGALIVSGQQTLMHAGEKSASTENKVDTTGTETGEGVTGTITAEEAESATATNLATGETSDGTPLGALPEENQDVVIDLVGDIMPSDYVIHNYDAGGIQGILSPELLAELTTADITVANEEFPFGTTGTPMPDKQYTFQVAPSYVSILQEMGIDVVSLANNHSLDYGKDSLTETFTTLDNAGILYVGAGDDVAEASALKVMEVNGKRIGFLAASRVIPEVSWNVENGGPAVLATYEATLLNQAITNAEENCDYLIVYVHWGIEKNTMPEEYERGLAEGYIEHGADAVIGSHPHVVQGVDWYNGKPIFYSLGNFIFYQSIERTMVLKITLDENMTPQFQILPASAENAYTDLIPLESGQEELVYIESLSQNTNIDESGMVTELQNN